MIAEVQAQRGLRNEAGLILKEALDAAHASQTPPERWPSCPRVRHLAASAELYVETLSDVAKAQAKTGLIEDAAATLDAALQFIPAIKDSSLWKADVSRSLALSKIAEAQSEAGLRAQSAATFERAEQAASEVREARWHIMALTRLARAQYKAGRVTDATRAFDEALEFARALENNAQRPSGFLDVLEAKIELGLAVTDATLVQAVEAARSIADKSRRAFPLSRIAQVQEKAERLQDAVITYGEALEAVDANNNKWGRINSLFLVMRGLPTRPPEARLIAESAPQVVRIAQSIEDELRRSEAFVVIARALPN